MKLKLDAVLGRNLGLVILTYSCKRGVFWQYDDSTIANLLNETLYCPSNNNV